MPIDHFCGKRQFDLRYMYNPQDFDMSLGGPVIVKMPGEGPLRHCRADGTSAGLKALVVCPEHRFFGESVPDASLTTQNLQYLTVEQNLKDVVSLIKRLPEILGIEPGLVTQVVAYGGSYSGACSAWIRTLYPDVVHAAIAESPPLVARMGFPEYDTSNLVALASPDARCAQVVARTAAALTARFNTHKERLMAKFNAQDLYGTPMGDIDFAYGLGDSFAGAVQYGTKSMICEHMLPVWEQRGDGADDCDWAYIDAFANFTLEAWGEDFFSGCAYNSTCMRDSVRADPDAESMRSWYWIKCTQLGYFQIAPAIGLTTRPRQVTLPALLEQCEYIFGPFGTGKSLPLITEEKVAEWNHRTGGARPAGSKIFETDYSDDPWKMTSSLDVKRVEWRLAQDMQPFLLLTCDGCAHCGSGVPPEKRDAIFDQFVSVLRRWGIGSRPGAQSAKVREAGLAQKAWSAVPKRRLGQPTDEDAAAFLQHDLVATPRVDAAGGGGPDSAAVGTAAAPRRSPEL